MISFTPKIFMYGLGLMSLGNVLKKREESIEVPSFRGVVEVKHKIKGRIRFRIPALKGNEKAFNELKNQLNRIDNIRNVESNPTIASLLIEHSEQIEATLIVGIIVKLLGMEEHIKNKPPSYINREFRSAQESINLAIDEKTNGLLDLKSMFFVIFTLAGIRKIMKYPKITPTGFTYLWWGYSMMKL